MGLIRSKMTNLTPEDDEELTPYLWKIVREIIKTAIENQQNLTVEGSYIPFNWKDDFNQEYLKEIRYYCLIMTKRYLEEHFLDIRQYANVIEKRIDDSYCTKELIMEENKRNFLLCRRYGYNYILIDDKYKVEIEW